MISETQRAKVDQGITLRKIFSDSLFIHPFISHITLNEQLLYAQHALYKVESGTMCLVKVQI